jgi:hypothetical protein
MMTYDRFEYMKETSTTDNIERVNELGLQGWELCAVRPNGAYTQFWFKRKIPSQPADQIVKETL